MSIRDTEEWKTIRTDLMGCESATSLLVADAIANALARHEAKHHGIEDATNPEAARPDDGWRERCRVHQTHSGAWAVWTVNTHQDQMWLLPSGNWVDHATWIYEKNPDKYGFPTEQAARDALAKAPKPEMKEARDGTV